MSGSVIKGDAHEGTVKGKFVGLKKVSLNFSLPWAEGTITLNWENADRLEGPWKVTQWKGVEAGTTHYGKTGTWTAERIRDSSDQ